MMLPRCRVEGNDGVDGMGRKRRVVRLRKLNLEGRKNKDTAYL